MTHAHVITGSCGAGKTIAIRWLMSHKPENELWVVILNEFTDAGLDALRDILRHLRPQTQRALTLDSVVCLIDPLDSARILQTRDANEWSQIQSADVLLLSKAALQAYLRAPGFSLIRESDSVSSPLTAPFAVRGLIRTGPGPSWLVQSHGRGLSGEDSAYRRDSRLEIPLTAQPTADSLGAWRGLLRDAALELRA